MSNPILDAARQRLQAITAERAALDREERELRAMVAAAEGAAVPVPSPVFPWPPTIEPSPMWPPFIPAPSPLTPWIVAPHGGMCACPRCCPPWTLGGPLPVGDVNQSTGSVVAMGATFADIGKGIGGWIDLSPPAIDRDVLVDGWRECGISDVTGGPYYVKPGATWDCNPAGIVAPNGVRYTS